MNERIQTLALECGAWQQVYDQQRFMHNHNFDIEKFAELIINKCANVVWNEAEKLDSHVVNDAGYKIIEYFYGDAGENL